jgi:hypothetical protein
MSEILHWATGLNGYKKHTLDATKFSTTITECEVETGREIHQIFNDHLAGRQTSKVEILYSGGTDSELVLLSCIKNNIPFEVMTMVIQTNGLILNTTDLYYSEKFCRQHDIKQNLFYFDPIEFYESGRYFDYLLPYNIDEPHVASHFWLIEQCSNYPIIGGDWPWVQMHRRVLSPSRLSYNSYEKFMQSKGITGIGNMVGYSFESSCKFIELHMKHYTNDIPVPYLKQKMYDIEPRLRSYGWEQSSPDIFNIKKYKVELLKKIGMIKPEITWGNKIATLIGSRTNTNSLFA